MGAEGSISVSVDLDANRATVEVDELFRDGELRLEETPDGWRGFVREAGGYCWVDTTRPTADWTRKQPVTERTVRDMVEQSLVGGGAAP